MKLSCFLAFFIALGVFSSLEAKPAVLENINYKVTLSETLPGLDDQLSLQAGPTIQVTIQDKIHSNGFIYPLNVYAIHSYFLTDNTLNLLCRTTPKEAISGPRYTFIQFNLSNEQDSRQFQSLKRYSFSPDNRFLLAIIDTGATTDSVALIRLDKSPAQLGWVYSNNGAINFFKKALPSMAQSVVLYDPIGWSADSFTAAFVASAADMIPDTQGQPVSRDYLACVQLSEDGFQVAAEPVDLSPYHYKNGSVIVDLKCDGGKITLFFNQTDSSDNLKAEFPLPKPPTP